MYWTLLLVFALLFHFIFKVELKKHIVTNETYTIIFRTELGKRIGLNTHRFTANKYFIIRLRFLEYTKKKEQIILCEYFEECEAYFRLHMSENGSIESKYWIDSDGPYTKLKAVSIGVNVKYKCSINIRALLRLKRIEKGFVKILKQDSDKKVCEVINQKLISPLPQVFSLRHLQGLENIKLFNSVDNREDSIFQINEIILGEISICTQLKRNQLSILAEIIHDRADLSTP
jgi:hypothetical protein